MSGPYSIGFDLNHYAKRPTYAVVASGTKEAANIVLVATSPLDNTMILTFSWMESIIRAYSPCLAFADRGPVYSAALEATRFGDAHDVRVRLVTMTRDTKERLAWQVQCMAERGRVDLWALPATHQVACALALDGLPIGEHLLYCAADKEPPSEGTQSDTKRKEERTNE